MKFNQILFLGQKKTWPTRKIEFCADSLVIKMRNYIELKDEIYFKKCGIHLEKIKENNGYLRLAVILPNGKYQWLDLPNNKNEFYHYNTISWIGDLDGDGKLDYILNFNGIGGFQDLYLSSVAEKGNAVKLVARLRYFGC
jgi:hypothetical protein